MRVLFGLPLVLLGILSILTAAWAGLGGWGLAPPLRLLWYADGYRPATFVVRQLVYFSEPDLHEADAKGTVEGAAETLSLLSRLKRFPESEEALEALVPVGTSIQVLYNPNASPARVDGEFARVVPYDADLRGTQRRRLWWRIRLAYVPVLVCVSLTAIWTWLFRWCVASTPARRPGGVVDRTLSPRLGRFYLKAAGLFFVVGLVLQAFMFVMA